MALTAWIALLAMWLAGIGDAVMDRRSAKALPEMQAEKQNGKLLTQTVPRGIKLSGVGSIKPREEDHGE
ncbi:MAG: hypothetical protein R3D29_03705 [Nitratireductor sp.]